MARRLLGYGFGPSLLLVLIVTTVTSQAFADVDKEESQIDWGQVNAQDVQIFVYVDSLDTVRFWQTKFYYATTSPDPPIKTHCWTDEGHLIEHRHFQYKFGVGGAPTANEVNAFWDARLEGAGNRGVTPLFPMTANNLANCHTWAFSQCSDADGKDTPAYNYWIIDVGVPTAYADDRGTSLGVNSNNVTAGCLLRYPNNAHTSIVRAVRDAGGGGKEPSTVEYKFCESAVYRYSTRDDGANEFNTPGCEGEISPNQLLSNQSWSWVWDWYSDPQVYPDD